MPETQEIKREKTSSFNWETKTLGEVCTIATGKKDANHAKENGRYRFYTCAYDYMFCDTKSFEGECLILPGNGANVGEVFYYNGDFEAYQRTYILSKITISPKFLYYHLCKNWKRVNQDKQYGSATNYIRMGNFLNYYLSSPPLPEQHRIVEKIEELFSELDNAITTLKTTQQQLQTYRQSVLKHAFEGHFTGGNKNWKLDRIGNVLDFINNGYTPSPAKMTDKGDVQFLKVYNLNFDGTLNYLKNPVFISKDVHENELKRSRTYPNDVLINIVGPPLGKVSIVPPIAAAFNINQAIVLFRPNDQAIPEFLRYFLQSPQVINWLEGTSKATAGQYNVKVSTCREIQFPLLDTKLQEKIVFEIETRLSESDYLLQTINQQLTHAESLRQSILQRAFSGELV